MRQKVRIITARTNKAKIPNQRKLELLALNQNLDESLKTMRINIEKCMAQANFNSKVQYELTRLHIKMEGNVITGLQAVRPLRRDLRENNPVARLSLPTPSAILTEMLSLAPIWACPEIYAKRHLMFGQNCR